MAQWLVLWTTIVDHCIVFILTQCNLIAKRGQITEPMGRGAVEETSVSTLFIFFTFIPNALGPENTFLKGP